jgi:photosystem II stability/assembly factor-like uncharacterized protein
MLNNSETKTVNYSYTHYSSDLDAGVRCTYFVDEKTGFAASADKIYKTTNSGVSWTNVNVNELPVKSIYFANKNLGLAVGGELTTTVGATVKGSIIYKTTNGGGTWIKKTVPLKNSELNSVCFVNQNIAFAVGLGLYVKSTDGGETWKSFELESGYQGRINKIMFLDSLKGFAVGTEGMIFETKDQGKNWTRANNSSRGHLYDICFVNSSTGYACGYDRIIKTTDGGDSWSILPDAPAKMYFIHFMDENNGIALGESSTTNGAYALSCTLDGGMTWKTEDNVNIYSIVHFPSKKLGYAVMEKLTVKIQLE